ncbi:MAG: class I SAM-dependent methyltransferase, partial [Kiritimatiellae bacterium]|nr:class I SAM-dependent methyltransferase [Kiritimatiellia bacterium]
MLEAKAREICDRLPASARVLDVGGGGSPFPRADYVLDLSPYEGRAALGRMNLGCPERFTPRTWIQRDVCDRTPWPFEDKFFDYAVCSHLLEDVRDPLWVCSELSRVACAGYVETPSRIVEQSRGVEHPLYAGFYHHRWLVEADGSCLLFRFKPHSLHFMGDAVVVNLGVSRRINPLYEMLTLEWQGSLHAKEVVETSEQAVNAELCAFARRARQLPNLVVDARLPLRRKLGLFIYFLRLK